MDVWISGSIFLTRSRTSFHIPSPKASTNISPFLCWAPWSGSLKMSQFVILPFQRFNAIQLEDYWTIDRSPVTDHRTAENWIDLDLYFDQLYRRSENGGLQFEDSLQTNLDCDRPLTRRQYGLEVEFPILEIGQLCDRLLCDLNQASSNWSMNVRLWLSWRPDLYSFIFIAASSPFMLILKISFSNWPGAECSTKCGTKCSFYDPPQRHHSWKALAN